MAIIMVDCDDCYARAEKFGEMSRRFASFAEQVGAQSTELQAELEAYSVKFEQLRKDIVASTDIWQDFYDHNVRLD